MGVRRALIFVALAVACHGVAAQDSADVLERRVKAAFLYRFVAYVEWPAEAFASPSAPIVLGVAGDDAMAAELEIAVAAREVAGRPLQVRKLPARNPDERCCHVLFIDGGIDAAESLGLLAKVQGNPVLTVTERDDGMPPGSVINFAPGAERIRFDISLRAAKGNRLKLRSQLLMVARNVTPISP